MFKARIVAACFWRDCISCEDESQKSHEAGHVAGVDASAIPLSQHELVNGMR